MHCGLFCFIPRTITVIVVAAVFVINILVDTFAGFRAGISVVILVIWTTHTEFTSQYRKVFLPDNGFCIGLFASAETISMECIY